MGFSGSPDLKVVFSGDPESLLEAFRQVQAGMDRTAKGAQRMTAQVVHAAEGMEAGFRRATRALTPYNRGLNELEAQAIRAAQGARAVEKSVHPIAAAMTESGKGTEIFAQRLRALKAQQDAAANGGRGLFGVFGRFRDTASSLPSVIGRARSGLTQLAVSSVATSGSVGALASALLLLAGGSVLVLGVAAGLAAIAFVYQRITKEAREAREATEKFAEAQAKAARQGRDERDPTRPVQRAFAGDRRGEEGEGLTARAAKLNQDIAKLERRIERARTSGNASLVLPVLEKKLADLRADLGEVADAADNVGRAFLKAADDGREAVADAFDRRIAALAQLRDAGAANAGERAEIQGRVAQLRIELARTTDVERRAQITAQLTSLTKEKKEHEDDTARVLREQTLSYNENLQALDRFAEKQREVFADRQRDQLDRMRERSNRFSGGNSPLTLDPAGQRDRDAAERVADQNARTRELLDSTKEADFAFQNMGESIRESIAGNLSDFFSRGILEAKSFGDAIRELARTVVQSIQQIVAQLIAAQIVKGIAGAIFGGGVPGSPQGPVSGGNTTPSMGLAAGGPVFGPGTGTSDSIPAWLSNGEFVVNAAATREHFGLLSRINGGWEPASPPSFGRARFADGGLATLGGSGGGEFGGGFEVGLDEGLIARQVDAYLDTRAGRQKIVTVYHRTPRARGQR